MPVRSLCLSWQRSNNAVVRRLNSLSIAAFFTAAMSNCMHNIGFVGNKAFVAVHMDALGME